MGSSFAYEEMEIYLQNNHFPDYLSELEACIGYTFTDRLLLLTAITHSTYTYEHKSACLENNERLELLVTEFLILLLLITYIISNLTKTKGIFQKLVHSLFIEATLAEIA